MRTTVIAVAAGAMILLAGPLTTQGAEFSAPPIPGCQYAWRCGPYGCGWKHTCRPICPDGYSCYPLYGAYGPYGGVGYWAAYTSAGWGSHRW